MEQEFLDEFIGKFMGESLKVEEFLKGCLEEKDIPDKLKEAMRYSLLAGGKRLRPVLFLMFVRLFGVDDSRLMSFAAGIECVHSYSLIHDDLPCMDDDDLRRGKPSNHKVFGEARAVLAGDGLLSESFMLMGGCCDEFLADLVLRAMLVVGRAIGAEGIVGGQVLDLDFELRENVLVDELKDMNLRKTGGFICACCEAGAIFGGASFEELERVRVFGRCVGFAFQIIDDVLDVVGNEEMLGKPVGSDERNGKVTYVSLLGVDECRRLANSLIDEAILALKDFDSDVKVFLEGLARFIVERVN